MPGLRRLPLRGVRARSVAAAVAVVSLALLLGALLMVILLQRTLIADVEGEAMARAGDVAALIQRDGIHPIADIVVSTTRPGQVVQVVDQTDVVVASSSVKAQSVPLTSLQPGIGQVAPVHTGRVPLLDRDSPFVVVVASVEAAGAPYRVIVAESIRAQQQSVTTVLVLLLVGVPLMLALVGAVTWILVGRALQPVERIRAQVAGIDAEGQLDQRVPMPQTGDEIARLAVTMNDLLAGLEASRRTQRQFVADAGHELRSPVATLAAAFEISRADRSGAALADLRDVLESEIERMSRLVENLLLLAKTDVHAVMDARDVDLDDILEAEARRLSTRSDLTIERRIQPARVTGDAGRLRQVVTNLVDNAARYARSRVLLSLQPTDAGAVLAVEDDGPGIPPADRERVFERFVRLDDSRERTSGGSGLGLAIVRELVAAHGGTVAVTEATQGGCRVEVQLPDRPPGQPPSGSSR